MFLLSQGPKHPILLLCSFSLLRNVIVCCGVFIHNYYYMVVTCKCYLHVYPFILSPYSLLTPILPILSWSIAGQRVRSPSVLPPDLPKDVLLTVKRTLFYKGPMSPMDNPEKFKTIMSLLSGYEVDIVSWHMCSISTTGVCVLSMFIASLKKSWL